MRRAASTYVFVNDRLHPGLLDGLARSGAAAIEIFAARGHFNYADRNHVKEIAGWFRSTSVEFHSMHSPMHSDDDWGRRGSAPINIAAADKKRRIEAMDEIKRALEVAEQAPFRFLVQHLGVSGEEFDPQKFEVAMTSIEHLRAFAKPLGVTLLLENIPNELSTPERLLEFVRAARFEDVGFCFDLGHAHIMGNVPQAFAVMKEQIRSTHVHDNAGDKDAHLWPGQGTIDWPAALALLHAAPQRPPVLLEVEGEGKNGLLEGIASAFEKLDGYDAVNREARQAS
jgi:sugar phosphate isomerase/epimerase